MKKIIVSALVFIVCFVAAYLIASYFPGMQIKLSAPPEVYFIRNLIKLWHIKSTIAGVISLAAGTVIYKKIK